MSLRWIAGAAAGAALVFALIVALIFAVRREDAPTVAPTAGSVRGTRTVELYLPGPDGGMVRETREIEGGDYLEEDVRRVLAELIAGGENGVRPLPASTRLLNVFHDDAGEITLNFSEHLRTDHPGGSESELATVRCLVSTIAANFAGVDHVRILIEGEIVPTLAGHADISVPLDVRDHR
ncbi:MAG: GerMN domain-containing protein [Candidatus Eiseniibacteriota bacterium]